MGYAGLHQLQREMKALPVDILKIDKVFIDMLPEDVSMVPAMIQLGARPVAAYRGGRGGKRRPAPLGCKPPASKCAPGPSVRLRFAAGGIQRALILPRWEDENL